MRRRFAVVSLAAAVSTVGAAPAVAADAKEETSSVLRPLSTPYSHVPLQLPETFVFFDARDLSQDGKVAGYVRVTNESAPYDIATVWASDGSRTPLSVSIPYNVAYAAGFQPTGQILGSLRKPNASILNAVVWNNSEFSLLPDLGNGAAAWTANQNLIVGETGDPSLPGYIHRLSLWSADGTNPRVVSGLPQDITSRPSAVNELGTYVGNTRVFTGPNTGQVNGFVGRGGTAAFTNYPGFNIARPTDINDNGWMVGAYDLDSSFTNRAFIAKAFDDEIHDLGLFPGFTGIQPQSINNDGIIVGAAINNTFERALIWQPGSFTPIDLNTLVDIPGETLVEAMDINNAGQILARGFNGYYIFTPIPEPASLTLILPVVLFRRRR